MAGHLGCLSSICGGLGDEGLGIRGLGLGIMGLGVLLGFCTGLYVGFLAGFWEFGRGAFCLVAGCSPVWLSGTSSRWEVCRGFY